MLLRAKLPFLDQYNTSRRAAAQNYSKAFEGHRNIIVPTLIHTCGSEKRDCDCHVFHQYTLRITNGQRDALVKHLGDLGIPAGVYYPIPLHLQKAYLDDRYRKTDFPVTDRLVGEVISLPMHTELDDEQIAYITSAILDFIHS